MNFNYKHGAVIFGIAILAILLAPKVIPVLKSLPIVGGLITAIAG